MEPPKSLENRNFLQIIHSTLNHYNKQLLLHYEKIFCLLYRRPLSARHLVMLSYFRHDPPRRSVTLTGHHLNIGDITHWISVCHGYYFLIYGAKVLHFFGLKKRFFIFTLNFWRNARMCTAARMLPPCNWRTKRPRVSYTQKRVRNVRTREDGLLAKIFGYSQSFLHLNLPIVSFRQLCLRRGNVTRLSWDRFIKPLATLFRCCNQSRSWIVNFFSAIVLIVLC